MKTIFLHGLGQQHTVWQQTIDHLAVGTECICPSLIPPELRDTATYDTIYEIFSSECQKIGGKINLCGLSLGAVMSLQYGMEHPDKVKAAVLIAAQYIMPKILLTFQNIVFRFMPASSFQDTGLSKQGMIRLTESMKYLDFSGNVGNISFPVLLLCGEKDKSNQKATSDLARLIPGASVKFMEGIGHEVNREAPEALAKQLDIFFQC